MSGNFYWNPVMDPDKSRELRKTGWSRHVRDGGRACPVLLTGIWLGSQICSDFLERLVQEFFLMICISPTHSIHPLDSTEVIGHK
jgi:hypothetical protein